MHVKKINRYLYPLVLLGVLAACERLPGPGPTPDPPVPPTPGIEAFDAAPLTAAVGESVTFSWRLGGVDAAAEVTCSLDVNSDGAPEYTFEGDACVTGSQAHTFGEAGGYTATLSALVGGDTASQQSSEIVIEASAGDFENLTWAPAAAQANRVAEAQGIALGGKLYVFGGFDSQARCCTPTERAQVYDPEADSWTPLAPLPPMNDTGNGGVTHAGTATDGSDIFLVSGYTSNNSGTGQIFGTREAWRYDVAADSYTRLPDLPVERSAGQLEYLAGQLHYFGGTNRSRTQDTPEHFVLDLEGDAASWTEAAPLPNARHHMGSAVLGGRIFAVGGQHDHDRALTTQADVHAYDPETDSWEEVAPLPEAVGHVSNSTFVMGGRIIVVGGEVAHGSPVADVFAYDADTDTWTALTPLPLALQSAVSAELNGEIIVTGGSGGGWRAETYRGVPQ